MTSIIPLHIAQRKKSVQRSANVNARFWPSSVTKSPDLAVVDCIWIDPRLYRTAVEGVKSMRRIVGRVLSPFGITDWYHSIVNRHQRTLAAIFEKKANIPWSDIENLLVNLGA